VIEKREFFEQHGTAAQAVRDEAVPAGEAVRQYPELAGTYLGLRAAELASRFLRDAQDRRRFVAQVRSALADDIERGKPLQPVRLRERITPRVLKDRQPLGQEVNREPTKHFGPALAGILERSDRSGTGPALAGRDPPASAALEGSR
jgi:hypothetical protein